jgi:hypothetical protein
MTLTPLLLLGLPRTMRALLRAQPSHTALQLQIQTLRSRKTHCCPSTRFSGAERGGNNIALAAHLKCGVSAFGRLVAVDHGSKRNAAMVSWRFLSKSR